MLFVVPVISLVLAAVGADADVAAVAVIALPFLDILPAAPLSLRARTLKL